MSNILVFLVQFGLGVALFFITNWIGKHSFSIGYMQISIFVKSETAPAFNFLFRVLSPVIYIIIVSAVLYQLALDDLVVNIFLVSIYYILFRIIFNLATNRARLLNWRRQIIHAITITAISWLAYETFIKNKKNILPDFSTISNELWIIIILFLFQTLNNLQFSSDGTEKRKDEYLKFKFYYFKRKFDRIIEGVTQNKKIQALAYAIMIVEDFNRPTVARLVENLKFRLTKKPMTLGVMQIRTNELIDDSQSVARGVRKLIQDAQEIRNRKEITDGHDQYSESLLLSKLVEKFNGGKSYNHEVTELFSIIWRNFYDGNNIKCSLLDVRAPSVLP